jgi:hypothetical protein
MKVEILEKIGEIDITCLRSAKESRAIASTEAERKAEIARIEKEREEQEAEIKTVELLKTLVKQVNAAADKGEFAIYFSWEEDELTSKGIQWKDWKKLFDRVSPTLEQMGYKCNTHEYCSSWRTRSGRIAHASISW